LSIFRRIDGDSRPSWSGIGSAGAFVVTPGTDFAPADDPSGRTWTMGRFDPHYHNTDEYWLIASGRGVIRIDEEQFAFGPGDIVCIEGGKVHDIVGCYERVHGFWFVPTEPEGEAPHLYQTPEDEFGHVIAHLSEAAQPPS
jgi:mannose-6-phosphate isomerase-like protein (cupin superfamily)